MTTTLKLNLTEALSVEEFRSLTDLAVREEKSLERLLFEAARDLVRRRAAAEKARRVATEPQEAA